MIEIGAKPIRSIHLKMVLIWVDEKECTCVANINDTLRRVLGIVGPAYSSKVAQISKLLSIQRLPMISYSSMSVELVDADLYPHLYRTIPNDLFQERFIKDLLRTFGWQMLHVIFHLYLIMTVLVKSLYNM